MSFPDRNSTNFPLALKSLSAKPNKNEFLRYHQFVIQRYVMGNPGARGLLLLMKMGYGKSIIAFALTRFWKQTDPSRKCVVLLSKSLVSNFKSNAQKYLEAVGKNTPDEIDDIMGEYEFVSYNASNMFEQISRVKKSDAALELEKKLGEINKLVQQDSNFLENSVLIVDEAHNFFNSITNGSRNAIRLYDTIMKTKDVKLVFLTGTPMVNHPFELAPCFNMLAGLQPNGVPLFPEERNKFIHYFVDEEKQAIKNANRFKNRIVGLSSYYGDLYFDDKQEDFPELIGPKVENVPMSSFQYSEYDRARELERAEKTFGPPAAGKFASGTSSSSYRIKSRQISNFCMPEHALGPVRGKKSRTSFVNRLTKPDLTKNLSKYSPKMAHLMRTLKKYRGRGVIYSEFVSRDQAIIARLLELNGHEKFIDGGGWGARYGFANSDGDGDSDGDCDSDGDGDSDNDSKAVGGGRRVFASITGQVHVNDRASILEAFNQGKIDILMISKAGSEGLDLQGVRHMHILEPYWNYSRIRQIIARAVRYKSHAALPKKDRNVSVHLYLSDYPEAYNTSKKKEETTDVEMYKNSLDGDKLIDTFILPIAEASVDCHAHKAIKATRDVGKAVNCLMCIPDDQKLFSTLEIEEKVSNPCKAAKERKIKASTIRIEETGETFHYTADGPADLPLPRISIYQYDDVLKAHVKVTASHPFYSKIYRLILESRA